MKRFEILFNNQIVATVVWILIDVILINLAFVLAYWIRYDLQLFRAVDPAFNVPYQIYLPFVGLFTVLLILVYRQQGVYKLRRQVSWVDEFYAIVNGTATGTIITIVIVFLYRAGFYSRIIFIYAGILSVVFLGLSRLIKVGILRRMRRRGIGVGQEGHRSYSFEGRRSNRRRSMGWSTRSVGAILEALSCDISAARL